MANLSSDQAQAAYKAVYAYIERLGDHMPPDEAHRNAMIWRAVEAALKATNREADAATELTRHDQHHGHYEETTDGH